jgi:hypothetical protein
MARRLRESVCGGERMQSLVLHAAEQILGAKSRFNLSGFGSKKTSDFASEVLRGERAEAEATLPGGRVTRPLWICPLTFFPRNSVVPCLCGQNWWTCSHLEQVSAEPQEPLRPCL